MEKEHMYIAKILFKNKVYQHKGQAFEDFFVSIMTKVNPEFQAVKAYGNIGDRKNDGFVRSTGTYYQVFAPEDITKTKTIADAVKKLETDFKALYENWNDSCKINKFFFVINDKYVGIPAPIIEKIFEINKNSLYEDVELELFTAKDLERVFESLDETQMLDVIGFIPTPHCSMIEYSALSEVISYLQNMELAHYENEKLVVPDFMEKIAFNNLNASIEHYLMEGSYQGGLLESYFNENPGTRAILQDRFHALYEKACEVIPDTDENAEDCRYFYILENAAPKKTIANEACIKVLMAYYFTTCDIFEEPR